MKVKEHMLKRLEVNNSFDFSIQLEELLLTEDDYTAI